MFFELPPPHPILVHFPSALVPLSIFCDMLALIFRRESLRAAAWWMLLFAAVSTPLAALSGWLWWWQQDRPGGTTMTIHQWMGTALAVLIGVLTIWRGRLHVRAKRPGWMYIVVAGVLTLLVVVQGHLGGMMTFGSDAAGPQPAKAVAKPQQQSESGHHWRDYIDVSKE